MYLKLSYIIIHMITEEEITKGEITEMNRRYGGSVTYDAEIETALSMGRGRSIYRKLALLWRAILVAHPFTDGNKRTCLTATALVLERRGFRLTDEVLERVTKAMEKVAEKNMRDLRRLERMVRYALEGY